MRKLLICLAGVACAHTAQLVPAPDAPRLNGAAVAEAEGIRLTAGGQRWSGEPRDLANIVTPLYVTVENGSSTPIRIRYREVELIYPNGLQVSAIPPFQIQRPGTQTVVAGPAFAADGFYLHPRYHGFYPGMPLWEGPWDYDPFMYEQMYGSWEPSLPTRDMLTNALPEGVLQPGGRAAGFLYFHRVSSEGRVTLEFDAVDANTRARIAALRIPMIVQ